MELVVRATTPLSRCRRPAALRALHTSSLRVQKWWSRCRRPAAGFAGSYYLLQYEASRRRAAGAQRQALRVATVASLLKPGKTSRCRRPAAGFAGRPPTPPFAAPDRRRAAGAQRQALRGAQLQRHPFYFHRSRCRRPAAGFSGSDSLYRSQRVALQAPSGRQAGAAWV